jgi:hypothetical protein
MADTDQILGLMDAFTEAAFIMLPESAFSSDDTAKRTALVFSFGALDAVIDPYNFRPEEKILILKSYLERSFAWLAADDRVPVISFLVKVAADPDWSPIMQRGGQSMLDWRNGNSIAPIMLSHIIRFGLEDADMMRGKD